MHLQLATLTSFFVLFSNTLAADCWGGKPNRPAKEYVSMAAQLCNACDTPGACKYKTVSGHVYCKMANPGGTAKYCWDAIGDIVAQCVNGEKKAFGKWSYGGEYYECGGYNIK